MVRSGGGTRNGEAETGWCYAPSRPRWEAMTIYIEEDRGKPYLHFTNRDSRTAVEEFIAEHGLKVDLSLSFMTAGGTLEGKPFEQWHAPIGEPSDQERELFRLNARRGGPW